MSTHRQPQFVRAANEDGTYFDYDDMEAHVMQRLTTAHYFHGREMQRYPGLNASQVIDSSSGVNASLTLPTYTNLPNFCHGSSHSDLLISVIRSIDNAQPPSSDPDIEIAFLNPGICSELKSPIIFHISVVFN